MIGFSIIMWFVSIVLFFTSIALLRGNTSVIHGKTFRNTTDKKGYAKALGKGVLFLSIGLTCCGTAAIIGDIRNGLLYALPILCVTVLIVACFFVYVQKKYCNIQ